MNPILNYVSQLDLHVQLNLDIWNADISNTMDMS